MALKKNNSTLEVIKYLSMISMIIDHVGAVLYHDCIGCREIGRFAYIGFAFLVAYNYKYRTNNKFNYKMRLLTWSIISQVPHYLAFGNFYHLNILFLLLISLYSIDAIETLKEKYIYRFTFDPRSPEHDLTFLFHFFAVLVLALVAIVSFLTGYGVFGVLIIILFYYLEDFKKIFFPLLLISIALVNMDLIYAAAAIISFSIIYMLHIDFKIKRLNKYLFYSFYPVHLMLLWFLTKL